MPAHGEPCLARRGREREQCRGGLAAAAVGGTGKLMRMAARDSGCAAGNERVADGVLHFSEQ